MVLLYNFIFKLKFQVYTINMGRMWGQDHYLFFHNLIVNHLQVCAIEVH